jgi:trimethylamine---corrinoid protein Co-methyltransferase
MEMLFDRIPKLTDDQLQLIHDKSVELLSRVGFRFASSERAIAVFRKKGFKTENDVVFFDEKKIRDALRNLKSSFRVRALDPGRDFEVGDGKFAFSTNAAPAFILDPDNTRRKAVREDYLKFLKIVEQTDVIDLVRPFWDVSDTPGGHFSWMIRWGFEYTTKAVSGSSLEDIELAAIAFGLTKQQMREKAEQGITHMVGLCSPRSPLTLETGNCDFVIDQAEWGCACKISPVPMAGMTAPVTLPGLIILQNAEVLAPMVLSQLVNPGAPVVYGVLSTPTDMKTSIAPTSAPETGGPIMRAGVQMAGYYGVPTRMDAANTDSSSCDFQAGAESALLFTNAVRSGSNIIAGLGSLESRGMNSLEKLLLDAELARYVKHMLKPLEFNEETMAVELMVEMGREAAFVQSDHTFDHFRETYMPELFQRHSFNMWNEKGKPDILSVAGKRVEELQESYQKPDLLPKSVIDDMEKYMLDKIRGRT